jgi:putative thioredoxin
MDYIIGQKPKAAAPRAESLVDSGGVPPSRAAAGFILDGDQRTFMQDVIDASRTLPVIVDFWATWCGPCKTLTPVLERVVTAAAGRLRLVKIDVDRNAALVQQLAQLGLPLKSVPTVAAFWQGQVADLFQGALPESEIKRFAEALLKLAGEAMPATDLLEQARAALDQGQPLDAADLYSAVLQTEPENPDGWGGLIRALIAAGDDQQAEDALAQVPAAIASHAQIVGARSAMTLAAEGREAAKKLGGYQRQLEADPADHQARYDLATALNAQGKRAEAADALLHIMRSERNWNQDAARMQLLKFFEAWGFDDPAAMAARRKLSALLFS